MLKVPIGMQWDDCDQTDMSLHMKLFSLGLHIESLKLQLNEYSTKNRTLEKMKVIIHL